MLYIVKLALRNIRRNTRRSLLAVLSVVLALFLMAFMEGLLNGVLTSFTENATKSDTGHVQITTKEFRDRVRFMPVDADIPDPDALVRKLAADPVIGPLIDVMAVRTKFPTLLEHNGMNKTALGIAGDPETERKLLMLDRSIVEGRYIAGPREIVVGAGLAKDLGIGVGAVLKVQSATAEGSVNMRKLTVVGIFRSGLDTLDSTAFQLPLADARALLKSGSGAQEIIVMLKDYRQADRTAELVSKALADPKLSVLPWSTSSDLYGFITLASSMYNAIYIFIALLGTVIIVNIMMMVVLERRREIGIMKALGVPKSEVLGIFAAEGFMLGIIGSVIGTLLGLGVSALTAVRGIDLGASLKGMNFPLSNVVHPSVTAVGMLKVFAIGIVTSGVISLLPARRAARMEAVAAMKSAL